MTTDQKPPCKFCQKKGFPILPVRIGVAPRKPIYPGGAFTKTSPDATKLLGSNAIKEVLNIPLGDPDAIYTARVLRQGYLLIP